MAEAFEDIRVLAGKLDRDEVGIWDIIREFQAGRDIQDLQVILADRPDLATLFLHVMNELSGRMLIPVWRSAAAFISSENWNAVFYALDVLHSVLPFVDRAEVVALLDRVEATDRSIVEKVARMRAEAGEEGT